MTFATLTAGDPAPRFSQRSTSSENYVFDAAAGRYLVLCFFVSSRYPAFQEASKYVQANRALFDDDTFAFFGVSIDPQDEATGAAAQSLPGIRYIWDFDYRVSQMYGSLPLNIGPETNIARPTWVVVDPTLRVLHVERFGDGASDRLFSYLHSLPPPERFTGMEVQAPILVLPNVFEAELCQRLISLYDTHGGSESGFMREIDGKTVAVMDGSHKKRRDYLVRDPNIRRQIQIRIHRRVRPEIARIFSFEATRMERYLVGCYTEEDGGHFRAHRDNTTKGTAHRRFAVSINLNHDFEGGEVSFPEYSSRTFKSPAGGAIIFPCALLHAVSRVTRGRRYAFLPFLYDDAAAMMREANNEFLEGGTYKADRHEPIARE